VFIKGGNGDNAGGDRWPKNASPQNLAPFLERGIEVWIFGYFYAPDIADADGRTWGSLEEQVAAITPVVMQAGVKGLVVDAEAEFVGRAEDAERLCKMLRRKLDDRAIAYTSFGWIKPNARFPFETFDRHCGDAFLPQVYYAFGWPGGVDGGLDRLEADRRTRGLSAPVWPVQSNEKQPSAEQMNHFFERAGPDASVFYLHPEGTEQTKELYRVRFR
jgi:hypothetical protein